MALVRYMNSLSTISTADQIKELSSLPKNGRGLGLITRLLTQGPGHVHNLLL